jgi:hypothetical protein
MRKCKIKLFKPNLLIAGNCIAGFPEEASYQCYWFVLHCFLIAKRWEWAISRWKLQYLRDPEKAKEQSKVNNMRNLDKIDVNRIILYRTRKGGNAGDLNEC